MKFAIAFAAFVAVAVASPYLKPIDSSLAELEAIVAAIQSPSTDAATAALLEQQLAEILEAHLPSPAPAPVVIDPAPISIGPAIIDFPLPDGGAVTAEATPVVVAEPTPVVVAEPAPAAVVPAPVVIGEAADASPLVQIIVNINSASGGVVAGSPAAIVPAPAAVEQPHPVQVVDEAVNPPTLVPTPVLVVEEPVHVAEPAPVVIAPEPVVIAPEPIQIGNPIIPEPIVLLPDTLN